MTFSKPIVHIATMINGHTRVFFDDDGQESELILMMHKKRGPVLPRRKRAGARQKGLIQ